MTIQLHKSTFLTHSWKTIYLALAVAYLFLMDTLSFPYNAGVKVLPILFLIFVVCSLHRKLNTKLLGALAFSAMGDVLLASPISLSFELGLGAFLIAHIFYIKVFWHVRGNISQHKAQLLVLSAYCITAAMTILPLTQQLFLPVATYMLAIGVMGVSSILYKGSVWVKVGAMSFILSDSLIATERFLSSFSGSGMAIMSTYYLAQYLIVLGVLKKR